MTQTKVLEVSVRIAARPETITLVPRGDATIVTLRHLGLPDDHHPQHTEGWQHYLKRLSQVSEGRDPGTDPMTNPPA